MSVRTRLLLISALTLLSLLIGAQPALGTPQSQQEAQEQEEAEQAAREKAEQERKRALLRQTDPRADQMLGPKDDRESVRPFVYLFPTAVQFGVDNSRVGDATTSDPVAVIVPAVFSIRAADAKSHLYAIYEPQVERFADSEQFNHWNHSGALAFDYQVTPRLSLGLGGSVLSTGDPTRAIAELPLVLERGTYVSSRGYASLGYRLARRTFLDLAFDVGYLRYDGLEGQPDVGIDEIGTGAIAGISHQVARAHTLGIRYAYVTSRALEDASELPEDLAILLPLEPQHGVDVGWEWKADHGLTFTLSAGIAAGSRTSWIGGASAEKEFKNLRLMVDYRRLMGSYENLAPRRRPDGSIDIGDGLLPRDLRSIGSAADILGATVEGRTDRLQVAGRLQLSLGSFDGNGPYVDGLTVGTGLKYRLTDRIQPYVQLDYITQGLSPELGVRRTRERYAAGLVLILGPSPSDAPLDIELERRRSLLPYAGAKRPW